MIKRALIGIVALSLSCGAIAADWYTATGAPATGSQGSSATMRNEFAAIDTAMDKLPTLTGNGSEVVTVNSGGTALESAPYLGVTQGGTGAATLTDGGILLGSGTGAVTPMSVLTDGQIVVGDGTTDPTTLGAFTSSTGTLKHEYGGLEADVSAVADGDFVVGTGAGTIGLESGATARATMGLGSIATQNSNAISVTGGSATGLTDLSTTNFSIGGTAVTATATELNYTDITTPGAAQASKAAVLGVNADISGILLDATTSDTTGYGVRVRQNSVGNAIIQITDAAGTVQTGAIFTTAVGSMEVGNSISGGQLNIATVGGGPVTINSNTVWHAGNDGAGSGLDADLLDGVSSSGYYQVSGTDVAVADGGSGASTVNGARENFGIYHGRVDSSGTAVRLPSGWTSVRDAAGIYTVYHPIGTTAYAVVASITTSGEVVANGGANSINILTYDSTGTYADASFSFIVILD